MSTGKPAARIDDKVAYARIVTGSLTVHIGSQGGVACSVCPGGKRPEGQPNSWIAVGNPVNPQLGAKVLSGGSDLDFALPGAMPLVWQRQYSSYVNQEQGGYCGVLGYGWGVPFGLRLSVLSSATLLHDSQGRTTTFDGLAPGESIYSPSEDIWLLRTGMHPGGLAQELAAMTGGARFARATEPSAASVSASTPSAASTSASGSTLSQQAPTWWKGRFAWMNRDMACASHLILAANGNGDTLWVFAPANWQYIEAARKALVAKESKPPSFAPTADAELPAPSEHWILLGKIDRLGRSQRYHWAEVLGQSRITGIEDGTGRHYQLHYTQALAAQDAQYYHHPEGSFFWQADSGVRLARVDLTRDPTDTAQTTQAAQPLTLVSYTYSQAGDLVEVRNRHGEVTRRFAWRDHLMVFHQEMSGPEHHYAYDRYEPGGQAIEQRNQGGINYQFDYRTLPEANGQPRRACVVTDSLGRVETYIFQGEAGLSRMVEHLRADGSSIKRSYNQYGHLTGVTDPLGRSVHMQIGPMGQLLHTQGPDGSTSSQSYDDATGLLQSATDAAGRTTRYQYDSYQRLTQVTLADGSSEQYHYPEIHGGVGGNAGGASGTTADPAVRLNADKPVHVTDAKGGNKHITYTSIGQTSSYTDCSGQTTRYEYTRWGQTLAVTNALGERTRYQYSDTNQLQAVQYPDGSSEHYQYDAQGQVSQVRAGHIGDASQNNTTSTTAASVSMEYDLWGRIVRRSHAGQSLGFAYDAAGRLTQLTNENGEHTTFAWDVMDRLTRETGFDARVQSYQYDVAGQLTQSADGWAAEQSLPGHISHYEWTVTGQLAARHLAKAELTPATTHRYQWGKSGELLQASVWHSAENQTPALQSQAIIERDSAGRVIGEIQRLFKQNAQNQKNQQNALGLSQSAEAEIEFEHRISHRLDVLGNREASQLHGLGEVGYLLYGSGHVHGITWQGESVVDFERDALHREVKRQLATTTDQPLIRQLSWDKAGRLTSMQWSGLEQGASMPDMLDSLPGGSAANSHSIANPARPPQAMVGALTSKHYHYDSLGQMVGIQTPVGMSKFTYDVAGRLTGSDTPHAGTQRWRFDPAGNRLPITGPATAPTVTDVITGELNETDRIRAQQRASNNANPVSKAQIQHRDYNALQGKPEKQNNKDNPQATQKWAGNRVAYYENTEDASSEGSRIHYQYDSRGNRTSSFDEKTGRQMDLSWDKGNQLVQVIVQEQGKHFTQSYRYDAFGRRLAKYNDPNNIGEAEESGTDYFGWDGDRLIHTERFNETNQTNDDGTPQPEVIHTIYEPHSFTPLIQLRQTQKAEPSPLEQLIGETPQGIVRDALRTAMTDINANNTLIAKQIEETGMQPEAKGFIKAQLEQLQETVNAHGGSTGKRIEVRHYLCDHLGTPNVLLNRQGKVDWAIRRDAWGNGCQISNYKKLHQPITLNGQQIDYITHNTYNRYRYYDQNIGTYLNQDPIGLNGGSNNQKYVSNPNQWIDALGLQGWASVPIFNGTLPGNSAAMNKAKSDAENLTKCGKCGCGPKIDPFFDENKLQFIADVGLPVTSEGWSDVFSRTSTWAGGFATVTGALGQLEVAIPLGLLAAGADAASKYLKPPPTFTVASDAAIDIIGAAIPAPGGWGVAKDSALNIYKKVISDEAEKTMKKPASINSPDPC